MRQQRRLRVVFRAKTKTARIKGIKAWIRAIDLGGDNNESWIPVRTSGDDGLKKKQDVESGMKLIDPKQ
jgi:hypothetical protein